MSDPTCPPLGTGSIDFAKLQHDLTAGKSPDEAVERARTDGAPEPAPDPEVEKSLDAMTKAELLEIAEREAIDLGEASNNPDRVAAIQAHRDAAGAQPGI